MSKPCFRNLLLCATALTLPLVSAPALAADAAASVAADAPGAEQSTTVPTRPARPTTSSR